MGLSGKTSWTLPASSPFDLERMVRYSDSSGRTDTNWRVFTAYWLTYNQVPPYELMPGESCYGVTTRFELRTDAAGCSSFSWQCAGSGSGVRWALSTSTTKPSTGAAATLSGGVWRGSTSNAQMLPNSTYYLWIWNNHSTCRMGDGNTLTVSGSGTYGRPGTITTKVNGADITSADMGSTIALSFAADTAGASYVGRYSFTKTDGTTRTAPLFAAMSDSTFSWETAVTMFDDYVTDRKSVEVTIEVEVFYGSISAGTSTTKITLNFTQANAGMIAASGWMTLTRTQMTEASQIRAYVQNYSKVTLTLDATKLSWPAGITGSLAGWRVKAGTGTGSLDSGNIAPNTGSHTSNVITQTGTVTVTVTATDGRGFSHTFTETITVWPYQSPRGRIAAYQRTDGGGDADSLGTYVTIMPDITISSIRDGQDNELNSITVLTLTAAPRDGGGGFAFTGLTNRQANTLGGSLGDKTWDLTLTATDALGQSLVLTGLLTSERWLIKGRADGNGIAFGKSAEFPYAFQVTENWDLLHGENRIPEIITGADGTTSGTDTELEPNSTYLLITSGGSAGLCGAFAIVTGSGLTVKLAGAADVTVAITNTTVGNETTSAATVTTASGTCGCFFLRIA